jgi:VIT1/CCC1 family predicted Fe2+/Mn2+ transporter
VNLQARLTESLKASQSALRVISQLETKLASAKAEIERLSMKVDRALLDNVGFIEEISADHMKRQKERIEKLEKVLVAAENIREIDHGCEKGDTDYCCYQYQDADIGLRNALAAANETP